MGFKVHTSYRALIHKTIEICIDLSLIVDEFDTLQWRPELRSVSCTHGNCQISTTSNSRQIWITKGITFFWLTLYSTEMSCTFPFQNGNIVWTETTIVRLNDIFIVSLPSAITIYHPLVWKNCILIIPTIEFAEREPFSFYRRF